MASEVFQCEFGRGLLKKIPGNEKTLFLEISTNAITGKAIVYPENSGNEYTSDINYDIKTITKIEKISYQGLDTFVIYVRSSSLYGVEKLQLRFPGMKDIGRASSLIRELIEANRDGYGSERPGSAPVPAPRSAVPPKPVPKPAPAAPRPAPAAPKPAAAQDRTTAEPSIEERKKQFEKMEAIYKTGMITEKEYKNSKAEYISSLNGLEAFFSKLKVNLQYSEIGFLSEEEFAEFKRTTIDECSELNNVSDDVFKQNLKKLLLLNLCEILSNAEYDKICGDIIQAVQYESDDPEETVVEKIQKWPALKECEILSPAQYDQFIKIVADDTRIKMGDSIPALEHKLMRLTTLSKTFMFTPEEFAQKKREFVADMTTLDYTSEVKLRSQIERLMTLKRCGWLDADEYQEKKKEVLQTIDDNHDVVARMQLFALLADTTFITQADYENFKQKVIDNIFSHYSDISELQKKAQTLMNLKDAGIISDTEFGDYKKKLLSL